MAREIAPPEVPARCIDRPDVAGLLDGALDRALTVLSAPAGFGKTLSVARWAATRCPLPVTWLAVDPGDVLELGAWLDLDEPRVLVVDGAGGTELGRNLAALAQEVEAAGHLHVVVLTRHDVAPDLAAARLTGAVEVILERHLRFSAPELAELVEVVAGQRIRDHLARTLVDAVEGWPAGAMLLALDWDRSCTIANHWTTMAVGYRSCGALLADLLVTGLDPDVHEALVRTACLPALGGDLWNQVTGRTDGDLVLDQLRTEGRFLTGVSADPPVYRLHGLARAGLRDPASRASDDEAIVLRRAAEWYAAHGLLVFATACLVELKAWDEVADLVLGERLEPQAREQTVELVRLLSAIPSAALSQRWSWAHGVAALLLDLGEQARALALLASAEPGTTEAEQAAGHVLRAAAAPLLEDPTPCLESTERVLTLCDAMEGKGRGAPPARRLAQWRTRARSAGLLAGTLLGDWRRGLVHDVEPTPADTVELAPAVLARVRGQRALSFALAGALADAEREAAGSREALVGIAPTVEHVAVSAQLATAEVLRGRCRREEALAAYHEGAERAAVTRRHNLVAAAVAGAAHVQLDTGRPDEALRLVLDHQRTRAHRPPPLLRSRLDGAMLLARHRLGDAARVRSLMADVTEPLTPVAATLVTIHLELGDLAAAERVLKTWPADPTPASEVHRRLGMAAVAEHRGQRASATAQLTGALAVAAPHGCLQPFTQLGVFVIRPLRIVAEEGGPFGVGEHARLASSRIDRTSGALGLLTPRERLVLHHLASTASVPQLAEQLMVSTNTLKTQVRAIYRKLGVARRAEAVEVWRAAGGGAP